MTQRPGQEVDVHAATLGVGSGTISSLDPAATAGGTHADPDGLELPVVSPQRYRVAGEKGRGGIGRVSQAQDRHLDRPVAIKELLHEAGDVAAARFVREALITARLQHPGVVPVYEAGRWPDGAPFYAMKLLSGRSLHEAIAERATLEERLGLLPNVLAVAETIAYAHGQGVVHRDLKPANVVVGDFGETVVIDWGLAKDRTLTEALDGGAADSLYELTHGDLTRLGSVVGTPAYMPVEQARGQAVDERADVYALGAILYRLLAGTAPYEGNSEEVLAQVLAGPAPRLSGRLAGIPRDLAAIVDKAMARAPAERYPTAKELAGDLSRFLTGQLVGAREYSRWSLLWRFVRRHRLAVAAAALLAVILVVSARRILHERDLARATSASMILTQARALVESDPTASLAWLRLYPDDGGAWNDVQAIAADASASGVARHVFSGHDGEVFSTAFSPDGRALATASADGVELWDVASGHRRARLDGANTVCLAFSADGRLLITGTRAGEVVVFDVQQKKTVQRVAAHKGWVHHVEVAPAGERFVSVGVDNVIRVWRLGAGGALSGPERELRGHEGLIDTVLFDQSGRLWTSASDGTVRRWELSTGMGEVIVQLPAERPFAPAAISADGTSMLTVDRGRVIFWHDGAWKELGQQRLPVRVVVLRPDGRVGVTASEDGSLTWWTPDGMLRSEPGHERPVVALTLAADGETLASADLEGTIRVWQSGSSRVLHGHRRSIETLAFTPDGRTLASASDDGSVRVWPVAPQGRFTRLSEAPIFRIAFAPDGQQLVADSKDGSVFVLARDSAAVSKLGAHSLPAYDLTFVPGGHDLVTSSWDGTLTRWSIDGKTPPRTWDHGARIWSIDVAADGRRMLSAGADGAVRLWQLDQPANRIVAQHQGDAHDAVFSPDGTRVASSGADQVIRVTELTSGAQTVLIGHTGAVAVLIFGADGRTLFSCGADGTVRAWDTATGRGTILTRHHKPVRTMTLSPDGRLLASGSQDKQIRVRDLHSGREQVWLGHTAEVRHLSFSPDGNWLASAGFDATVRLWSLRDGRVAVLRGHVGLVHRVAFSPDGAWLASAGDDGRVGLWQVATVPLLPADRASLTHWLGATTSASVSAESPLASPP